jgi:hypothetical protein
MMSLLAGAVYIWEKQKNKTKTKKIRKRNNW